MVFFVNWYNNQVVFYRHKSDFEDMIGRVASNLLVQDDMSWANIKNFEKDALMTAVEIRQH